MQLLQLTNVAIPGFISETYPSSSLDQDKREKVMEELSMILTPHHLSKEEW